MKISWYLINIVVYHVNRLSYQEVFYLLIEQNKWRIKSKKKKILSRINWYFSSSEEFKVFKSLSSIFFSCKLYKRSHNYYYQLKIVKNRINLCLSNIFLLKLYYLHLKDLVDQIRSYFYFLWAKSESKRLFAIPSFYCIEIRLTFLRDIIHF